MSTTNTVPVSARVVPVNLSSAFPEASHMFHPDETFNGLIGLAQGVPQIEGYVHQPDVLLDMFVGIRNPRVRVIALSGPTGCGKSSAPLDLNGRLGRPIMGISANSDVRSYHFTGITSQDETGRWVHKDSQFIKCVRQGIHFLLDEAHKLEGDITSMLHKLVDCGTVYIPETGETVYAHERFKLILTTNDASGTKQWLYGGKSQDHAFKNRVRWIDVDYPSADVEVAALRKFFSSRAPHLLQKGAGGTDLAEKMVAFASDLRRVFVGNEEEGGCSDVRFDIPFSTRNLIDWADEYLSFSAAPATAGIKEPLVRALGFVSLRQASKESQQFAMNQLKLRFGIQTDGLKF